MRVQTIKCLRLLLQADVLTMEEKIAELESQLKSTHIVETSTPTGREVNATVIYQCHDLSIFQH